MRTRISHRWRIALASTAVSAALMGALLASFVVWMFQTERRAASDLLESPLREVLGSIRSNEPLDEEVGAQERVTVVVFAPDGRPIFRSGVAPVGRWSGSGEVRVEGREFVYRSVRSGDDTVVAASDWTESRRRLYVICEALLVMLPLLAAAVGLAAYIAAGLMYRPLRRLTHSAKALADAGKIGRLEDPGDPDFTPLARELNALLVRIEEEMARQERLVSDVAHDLRTPLTIIRGRLETALLQGNPENYASAMRTAIREAERLSAIADAILMAGDSGSEVEAQELSTLVLDAVSRWRPQFEQKGGSLTCSVAACRALVWSEEVDVILDNLLDNALKHGGKRCTVKLKAGETTILEVMDDGAGVPPQERECVFERFTRLDVSRSTKGNGLGLYLCAALVRKRGGAIGIPDGPGMTVRISLPPDPDASAALGEVATR